MPVPKKADEDEESNTYGISEESAEEEARQSREAEGPGAAEGPSAQERRGPAMALCTPPANRMLATASFICVSCVVSVLVLLWPVVFASKPKEPDPSVSPLPADGSEPEQPKAPVAKKTVNWPLFFVNITVCVLAFAYNATIVFGAVKMMGLESYPWGMGASVMTAIPVEYALGTYGGMNWLYKFSESIQVDLVFYMVALLASAWFLFVGATAIKTLRDPKVLAGFAEKKPVDV